MTDQERISLLEQQVARLSYQIGEMSGWLMQMRGIGQKIVNMATHEAEKAHIVEDLIENLSNLVENIRPVVREVVLDVLKDEGKQ